MIAITPLNSWMLARLYPACLTCALLLIAFLPVNAVAQKPKPPGGGSTSAYTLVDLVSPYHSIDGNWSDTEAVSVSRRATAQGPLYVAGNYARDSSGNNSPCLWTVSPTGSVSVLDLSTELSAAEAVNSGGIVGGRGLDNRPAIRFPSGIVVSLTTPGGTEGGVTSITELTGEPGQRTLRAVGSHGITSDNDAFNSVWILSESGALLDAILLRDAAGTTFQGTDINSNSSVAGTISVDGVALPAIAQLIAGELFILPLSFSYAKPVYLWEGHINDGGDAMVEAGEPVPGQIGVYRRTFVWPSSGGMINLSDLNGGSAVAGLDLALVNGQSQIVGEAYSSKGWYGFLYNAGQLQDINQLVSASSWNLWGGRGISNDGHIVGVGRLTVRRNVQFHGFLLMKK